MTVHVHQPETAPASIRVNDRSISEDEIARELQYHPAADLDQARQKAATALAIRALLLSEADRLGITSGESGADGDEARIGALLERELSAPEPDEASCRAWYEKNREQLRTPGRYRVSHILRPAPADDADARVAARTRCRRLIRLIKQDSSRFAALAQRHSRCPSACEGGDLGEIGPGQTCREFEKALERFPVGEVVAHPLETRYGFHVVWLHERIPGQIPDFEQVRETVANYLSESVWRRSVSQYLRVLAGQADIRGIDIEAASSPLVQ